MLRKKSVTEAPSVLMAGYTTKRIFFTIKNKAVFGIDFKGTATKTGRNVINNFFTIKDFNFSSIKIRVFFTVPKANTRNFKSNL